MGQPKTKLFQLFPWVGGLNTAQDESVIPPNQLTAADNIVFGVNGSRKKRDGIAYNWDDASSGSDSLVGGFDFWFGTPRAAKKVTVTSAKKIYSYNPTSGARSADLFAGTAWASAITFASFSVLNNLLIISADGAGNVLKKFDGTTVADLGGTPPVASITRVHLGRVFTNDKTNPDRLQYSATFDPETWGGASDSGALDIGVGDGDPGGITAIFPPFKGVLFVAKRTKLYRIDGDTPETFSVTLVTDGLGAESHDSAVAIEDTDVVWCSSRGFHSVVSTNTFGDLQSKFLSKDIQKTFNDSFVKTRLSLAKGAYLNQLNSVAFAVTDSTISSTYNNAIYLYNLEQAAWYRWPTACECLFTATDSDGRRFYIGTNTTRLAKALNNTIYDISTSGTHTAISMLVRTGRINLDGTLATLKGLIAFSLIYKPEGTHTITATLTLDNYAPQAFSFSQTNGSDLLGSTFVLGASALGTVSVTAPYTFAVDGIGRAFQVELAQSGVNERAEIFGIAMEYEPDGLSQEVNLRS
jgi:hypothetical protein